MLKTKRVYEPPSPDDGYRVLTERLWPRGVSKDTARLDRWLKEVAPSHELRKWFSHDPQKWDEFRDRYLKELYGSGAVEELVDIISENDIVTMVYASKDENHNSTVLLKEFLEKLLESG